MVNTGIKKITTLTRIRWSPVIGCAILFAFLFLFSFHQPIYPAPWFDEGLNLSTAMVLAQQHAYGLPDSVGLRILDPAIQTGPTVILPVAIAFHYFGIDVSVARYVLLLFALFTLATYFGVARQLLGNYSAWIAIILLLVGTREPDASFVQMSRQVLGEVPALGFFLAGLWLWWRTIQTSPVQTRGLIFSGILWGLAAVTKSQMMMIFFIYWIFLWILNITYYRKTSPASFIIPGILALTMYGMWYVAQYFIAGPIQFQENITLLWQGFTIHVGSLNIIHIERAFGIILKSGWLFYGIPVLAWGFWRTIHRTQPAFVWMSLVLFPAIALVWFAVFSIGWSRYAFFSFIFTPFFLADALREIWQRIMHSPRNLWKQGVVVFVVLLLVVFNCAGAIKQLVSPVDTGYQAMSAYLQANMPENVVVETWEWELSVLPGIQFHHPATAVTNAYTLFMYSNAADPTNLYNPLIFHPMYILSGPFSEWTGIYNHILKTRAQLIVTFGDYALYKVN